MKRLICILLLVATLLSVFTVTAFAEGDDNVTGGDGDTADALAGYGWYNTFQFMWKVSLYIGKSDQATTNGNLTNDYYQIGEYVYVKRSWTIPSGTQFGTGTKVSQYSSGSMGSATSVKVVVDGDCPAVPVACEGDIPTVKAYFGSTGTMSTILNALAEEGNTTKYGLVSEKNFTIGGVTKSGWPESYLLPSSSMTNRVPWVIIYEPVVLANMKDRVTKLAFTATEFAIAQKNGWYNFRGDYYGENAQKISKLTHQHLPTSVQLEESWYGYPVYNVTNDGQYWTDDNIIRGGGWGMRYLPVSIMEPVAPKKDFSVSFGLVTVPSANGYGSVNISFKNNKSFICSDVFCELYRGTTLVWSGYKNFLASQTLSQIVSVYYSGSATQTLTAKINYEDRNSESNPHNNIVTHSVTPTTAHVPLETTSKDFGVYFGTVDTPDAIITPTYNGEDIDTTPIGAEQCSVISSKDDINGKIIVIKPEAMRREYRAIQYQLLLCNGGFGASSNSRGSAVFCNELFSGKSERLERNDILGTLDPDQLPEWAKERLLEIKQKSKTKDKEAR